MKHIAIPLFFIAGLLVGAILSSIYQYADRQVVVEMSAATNLHNTLMALRDGTETQYTQGVLIGTLLGMSSWSEYDSEDVIRICAAHEYFSSMSEAKFIKIVGESGVPVLLALFREAGCVST